MLGFFNEENCNIFMSMFSLFAIRILQGNVKKVYFWDKEIGLTVNFVYLII